MKKGLALVLVLALLIGIVPGAMARELESIDFEPTFTAAMDLSVKEWLETSILREFFVVLLCIFDGNEFHEGCRYFDVSRDIIVANALGLSIYVLLPHSNGTRLAYTYTPTFRTANCRSLLNTDSSFSLFSRLIEQEGIYDAYFVSWENLASLLEGLSD